MKESTPAARTAQYKRQVQTAENQPSDDLVAEIVDFLMEMAADSRSSGSDWIHQSASVVAEISSSPQVSLRIVSDYSWRCRVSGSPILEPLSYDKLLAFTAGSKLSSIVYMMYLQSARFDFRFKTIKQAILTMSEMSKDYYPAYYEAVDILADLGQGSAVNIDRLREVYENTSDTKVLHTIAHGLWFSRDNNDAPELLKVTEKILGLLPQDPVALYRRSSAFRKLGEFSQATQAINEALYLCGFNMPELNSDLIRERQQIALQSSLRADIEHERDTTLNQFDTRVRRAEENIRKEITAELSSVRKTTSEALFKVVEILGLFTAIIAVVATGLLGGMADGISWWQRILVVVTGAASSLLFFWLLRKIVRADTDEGGGRHDNTRTD